MSRRSRLLLALLCATVAVTGCGDPEGPRLGAKGSDEDAVAQLGFPALATRNTVRVGGGDPLADAAGIARAVYPATSPRTRPSAVVVVDKDDWRTAIAAAVLAAPPIRAPLLLSDGGDLPGATRDALDRLKPSGSDLARDAAVIRAGEDVPAPDDLKAIRVLGQDPYETAAEIDRLASAAAGKPSGDVVVAPGEDPEFAMPAAAWAARSGDSVLFSKRKSVPASTRKALERHEKPDIFVLGPERAVGRAAIAQLRKLGKVRRVGADTPVENAIAFARYEKSGFGWGVTVPGFNFTVANAARPLEAAAAASLGSSGTFAPLLLTDEEGRLPKPLEDYFLDVQPGYEDDPALSVYNRVWILGDEEAVSLEQQVRIDEITRLVPVQTARP